MRLAADLHLHSRHARATSREADLEGYYRWALVKGIQVVGTGDFTHPGWLTELGDKLVENDGLYELRETPRGSPLEGVSPAGATVRFMLTAEISSIYRKHGLVRKVHSLICVPRMEDARRLSARLAAIGNVASDGRPILGLDPKDLLSILLDITPEGFLVPAHVWTPWFSLFGSKSGFDAIEECFEELTPHIFALETGLSSDPAMNWRWSALDRYRLLSNSDAHSPANLGREANLLDTEQSWEGVTGALRTGTGFLGTVEFFPEEGKYHFDGHRTCGVCMDPAQTARAGGLCPACGKPLTVGVLSRVLQLADRQAPAPPRAGEGFRSLIPLPELLSELLGTGKGSRAVEAMYGRIIGAFGSEFSFLMDAEIEGIRLSLGPLLAEAVRRMREGRVDARPGYDGEFGVIRVFDDEERERLRGQDQLFPAAAARRGRTPAAARALAAGPAARGAAPHAPPAALDAGQQAVLAADPARGLVFAGPGTGKTRLLAAWVAAKAAAGAAGAGVLALTFTNRSAAELRERLEVLAPVHARHVTCATFHSFSWSLIREQDPSLAGIAGAADRAEMLAPLQHGATRAQRAALGERMERCWEGMEEPDPGLRAVMESYQADLRRAGFTDISSLVSDALALLRADEALRARVRARFPVIAVDELQDINGPQYALLSLLCETAKAVLCIGDPDQAIYGFRGSHRDLFFRYREESGARSFSLNRNYRSSAAVVEAANALMAAERTPGIPPLTAVREQGPAVEAFLADDPNTEGRYIAAAIRDLVGGVDAVSVDAARARGAGGYAFCDIAVLFRTRAVRDALLPALADAGLPLSFGTARPLSEEEPLRSLVAALRLVANPRDPVSRRILAAHQAENGLDGALDAFLERCPARAADAAARGLPALIEDLLGTIVRIDTSDADAAIGVEIIRESAGEFSGDLPGFLTRLSLCARESEGPRAAQRVSLLTFHAAKGLEFPVVFIAGAEEGITPLAAPRGAAAVGAAAAAEDLREERRLFYVAVTRARDHLCITGCRRRSIHGQVQERAASRWLSEMPRLREASPRRARPSTQLSLFG
jgi:DNA helicase II / ATP-dependent DNA helicase PcrA